MLTIIYEKDDPELMELVWAFRHTRFVDQMGWEELRRTDRRERDEYDTPEALHAVLMHEGAVVGYSRLLPTIGPHLSQGYSHLALPSGPYVFEWSRCATALNAPCIDGVAAADLLMTGVLEYLVRLQARAILFLTYPALVAMMRRRGYPVEVLAEAPAANGEQVKLVFSTIPGDLLSRHRQRYGIHGTILSYRKPEFSAERRSTVQ